MRGWKKERIVRVLLNHSDGNLSMYRVAKEAKTHHSWAIKIIKRLQKKGFLKGTEVTDAPGLFNYWLENHKKPEYRDYNVRAPVELLERAKKQNLEFALTTYSAENSVQKYLFLSRYDIYVKDLEKWHELAMEDGVRGGGNFRVLHNFDLHVFYKSYTPGIKPHADKEKPPEISISTFPVVSVPQLILDLLEEGGPCKEAAELLIKRNYGGNDVRKD